MNYKQYEIIVADTTEELTKLLEAKLKMGWQPWGSPNHYLREGTIKKATFYQAIVQGDAIVTKVATRAKTPVTTKKVLD